MAEIINLNKARKAKARDDKTIKADENRAKFGRSKGEKLAERIRADKADRDLSGHKRDPEPS
jgi:hypothetical protein